MDPGKLILGTVILVCLFIFYLGFLFHVGRQVRRQKRAIEEALKNPVIEDRGKGRDCDGG